jgi:hypothetical protein
MHALVRFANLAAGSQFQTKALHGHVAEARGMTTEHYTLGSRRYDLSKIRAKGLVQKVERTHRYRLTREGYSVCVVFLKLFERIYGPLTAGSFHSSGSSNFPSPRWNPVGSDKLPASAPFPHGKSSL